MKIYKIFIFFIFFFIGISCERKEIVKKEIDTFLGVNLEGLKFSIKTLDEVKKEIGFTPSFINLYLQWPDKLNKGFFPHDSLNSIWNYGSVPILTWEPMVIQKQERQIILYENILSGKYDSYLEFMAKQIKTFKNPLIIRFAHEMNLEQYHWGIEEEAFNETYPLIYQEMWKYLYNFFKEQKVKNVLWAFCPNCDSIPNEEWNNLKNYYPGDEFVDLLGIDGYNWGKTEDSQWRSFSEIFAKSYKELKEVNPEKPIFIFETATVSEGGNEGKWISEALADIEKWDIKAMIWFQIDKEKLWKITPKEKKVFNKFKPKAFPQQWMEDILNEKNKSFKRTR